MSIESRMLGATLGGALGDAIGLFTEFLPRSRAIELYGLNPSFTLQIPLPKLRSRSLVSISPDHHRSAFAPSGWTDDTDQSLLILLSFLASGGTRLDSHDFALRLKFWVDNGLRCLDRLPLGLGRTVGSVVRDKGFESDPIGTAVKHWEATNRYVAANGAVMRTAMVGVVFFQDYDGRNGVDRAMDAAVQIAATTHPDPRCLVSCTIVTALVATLIRGELNSQEEFDRVVQRAIDFIQNYPSDPTSGSYVPIPLSQDQLDELHKHVQSTTMWWCLVTWWLTVYAKTLQELELDDRQKIGYTFKCLGAGTWALRHALKTPESDQSGLFERCTTEITMQGGDADTNATVAGSLLGAYLTQTALPAHWVEHLRDSAWLAEKTRCAAALIAGTGKTYDPATDPDVRIDGEKGAFEKEELNRRFDELMCEVGVRVNGGLAPGKTKDKDDNGCVIA